MLPHGNFLQVKKELKSLGVILTPDLKKSLHEYVGPKKIEETWFGLIYPDRLLHEGSQGSPGVCGASVAQWA